jgi:hypothetical protein
MGTAPREGATADDLAERVARFTRRPHPNTGDAVPTNVVLVPPLHDIRVGFERARELLSDGPVRLVGDGVTLEPSWPEWVRATPGLVLSELGAYRSGSRSEATRGARRAARAWLDALFEGLTAASGAKVFHGSATNRLFEPAYRAIPFAAGLAEALAGCTVHFVRPWAGTDVLVRALERRGAIVWTAARGTSHAPERGTPAGRSPKAARRMAHRVRFATEVAARAWVQAAVGCARMAVEYARTRDERAVAREGVRRAAADPPSVWTALLPTWDRINAPIVRSFVKPALARRERVGALLYGQIRRGKRDEHDLRTTHGDALWPGLGDAQAELIAGPLAQVAVPDGAAELARTTLLSALRVARATARLARSATSLELDGHPVHLAAMPHGCAALVGIDVVRATASELAARRLCRSVDVRGCQAVIAAWESEICAWDVTLQAHGATTVEYFHGAAADSWPGGAETSATVRLVWTQAEVDAADTEVQPCVVAGMPRPVGLPERSYPRGAATAPRRVLLMTNYVHRDSKVDGVFPFEPALRELVGLLPRLTEAVRAPLSFRWRPHPADAPAIVDALARELGSAVSLSRGVPLVDDLAWADVVVSSASTTVFEALFADVPLFVHAMPELWASPMLRYFDRRRIFYFCESIVPALVDTIAALDHDPNPTAPERETRRQVFPPHGEPLSVTEALSALKRVGVDAPPRSGMAQQAATLDGHATPKVARHANGKANGVDSAVKASSVRRAR